MHLVVELHHANAILLLIFSLLVRNQSFRNWKRIDVAVHRGRRAISRLSRGSGLYFFGINFVCHYQRRERCRTKLQKVSSIFRNHFTSGRDRSLERAALLSLLARQPSKLHETIPPKSLPQKIHRVKKITPMLIAYLLLRHRYGVGEPQADVSRSHRSPLCCSRACWAVAGICPRFQFH